MKIETDILGNLLPNILTVVVQLAATGILFFLMYRLAWKPVKKILDERSAVEQERLEKAKKIEEENLAYNAQAKQELDQARKMAQEAISQAQEEAGKLRNNLIEEGKKEASRIIEDAQRTISLQKKKMLEDMHGEMVDVALSAAEKMLNTKLDSKADEENINKFIKEVSKK